MGLFSTTASHWLLAAALSGLATGTMAREPARLVLPWAADPPAQPAYQRAAEIAQLGAQLFADPRLSASGAMSCATCHVPTNHFAPTNGLPVQMGGPKLDQPGTRATPGLAYRATTPFFTEHYYDSDGNEAEDAGPTGGRTWDGRVDRVRDQATIPLLAANEMANASEAAVVASAARAPYAAEVRKLYGADIFDDPQRAFRAIGEALEAYQQTPAVFGAFTSKYDAFLRGQVQLTAQEARGRAAFEDPAKGNCANCHRSQVSPGGIPPLFTDFGLIALGLPRNARIPANADPAYFDLGACGPLRHDLADHGEYCGLFKAPSLRNVATRKTFFHNGVITTLEDAVAFYATRDTDPGRWFPVGADGKIHKFNDLPPQYRENVNDEPPFGGRPGEKPALSDQDIADIVAFLKTLTDGFDPGPALTARTGAASR